MAIEQACNHQCAKCGILYQCHGCLEPFFTYKHDCKLQAHDKYWSSPFKLSHCSYCLLKSCGLILSTFTIRRSRVLQCLPENRQKYTLLPRRYRHETANTSCGLIAKFSANAIPSVAPILIPNVIARGCSAANLLNFSRNALNTDVQDNVWPIKG